MHIIIDTESPDPLFAQVIEQIKIAVKKKYLKPGDPLPSIRQLSNDLEVNSKTIAKSYRLLERDGLIQSRGYRGTFVHPQAVANSKVDLNAWVEARMGDAVKSCREEGATLSEIRIAFSNAMQNYKSGGE